VQTGGDLAGVYRTAIDLISQYRIDSTYDIIQLASIVTPPGRQAGFEQMHRYLMSEPQERRAFELEIVNLDSQLAKHE
jgi:hypothetical protein